jgi:site-specific recombinase
MTTPARILREQYRTVTIRFIALSSVGVACMAVAATLGVAALWSLWWALLCLGVVLVAGSLRWISPSRRLQLDLARAEQIKAEQLRVRAAQVHATQCHFRMSQLGMPTG